jgi:hypothetical protein
MVYVRIGWPFESGLQHTLCVVGYNIIQDTVTALVSSTVYLGIVDRSSIEAIFGEGC